MVESIEETLEARGKTYGEYKNVAVTIQELKDVMRSHPGWKQLSYPQREALEMIQHKIGRILNGNPRYYDSWHDIVGYAKLAADLLLPQEIKSE